MSIWQLLRVTAALIQTQEDYQLIESERPNFTDPTGPCQTSGIEAVMDCEADYATISWQPSVGAASYVAELTAPSGHITRCATNRTNCERGSLQCGQEYNVTVKALGDTCNSSAQMAGYLTTGT